jgi:Domain of unknown function (DUF5659)
MSDYFETNDLYLAATLQSLGLEMVGVERDDPRRVRFVFTDDERRREWTRQYLAGALRVDPLVLLNSLRAMKRQIYQGEHGDRSRIRVIGDDRRAAPRPMHLSRSG